MLEFPPRMKVVYHPLYESHYPTASVESPERVKVIRRALETRFPFVEPSPVEEEDLLLVHSPELIARVKADARLFEVALMAVGGALKACEIAQGGEKAFALVRPPGHHARKDFHWGFCYFNNLAIAVQKALITGRAKRVFILDIDLHYGDGTADIFAGRKEVKVINVQEDDRERFLQGVTEALRESEDSDMVAISAGFDRYELDWGRTLKLEDFRTIGREIAKATKGKACFAVLEGGYYLPHLGLVVKAFLEGLSEEEG